MNSGSQIVYVKANVNPHIPFTFLCGKGLQHPLDSQLEVPQIRDGLGT
jgi:hypothetical protein